MKRLLLAGIAVLALSSAQAQTVVPPPSGGGGGITGLSGDVTATGTGVVPSAVHSYNSGTAFGSAAAAAAGTTGHTVPFLDGTNTWSSANTFNSTFVVVGGVGINTSGSGSTNIGAGTNTGSVGIGNSAEVGITLNTAGNINLQNAGTNSVQVNAGGLGVVGGGTLATNGALAFGLVSGGRILCSATAPTISSGFGTAAGILQPNGTCSFQVNVGTGGVATSGVIGLPAATFGWFCTVTDITTANATVFITKQIASTNNSCTVANFTTAGVQGAWAASDRLYVSAMGD